ncbi:MAG: carbohydrate-binding protein [Clostridia bacterium]|nr:carbohydrate-binding protein [Clostridia bacterium]
MLCKRGLSILLMVAMILSMFITTVPTALAANTTNEELDYMYLKNANGPSGVALGGIGVGYYEIDPTGKFTRNCVNNIHKSFADKPNGFLVGVWDGQTATRLQRDNTTVYGMKGYTDSYYTGLWPYMNIDFKNSQSGTADMGFSAYSGLTAHNVKDSSLPVVYYDVVLKNDGTSAKTMSTIMTWGDLIGRGMRDSDKATLTDLNGESADWYDMPTPQTYAKGVQVQNGGTTYTGVMQYAKDQLLPKRATFQNYNNAFMILAEDTAATDVTILKNFDVNNSNALSAYTSSGKLNGYDTAEVALSAPTNGSRSTTNGSAVAVSATVPAGQSVTVKLMVSWFAPEITEAQYANMHRFSTCDFNKYYHNYFSTIDQMTAYAIGARDAQRAGIAQWQDPILNSSMPEWLQFKQINSGYTLYSCGVLNKRGNFSTLEGEMGGYGGTMDQKMSSYPVYEKLFPELNLTENRQFANVTGANGEIQHFDIHYYYGMSDYENKDNPTPAGSMIDNSGTWMMQMWNHYRHTADVTYLQEYYPVMKQSMNFLQARYPAGTHIPSYNTTYDDYAHPQVMVYSGTVWLHMLDLAQRWATLMGESDQAAAYAAEYQEAFDDVNLYYNAWSADLGYDGFYAYGSNGEFLSSNGQSGDVESAIMFSGAMAGQFISRMNGQGDVLPFDQFVSHMKTFLQTSVQQTNDYMAPKVYNIRTEQGLDWLSSNCWPFYLESYGGMAAIQAGYLEDGLEILEHTSLVDLRLGYTWTRSLWTRNYITYMTAPVSWMIGDVLAGASVDAPNHTLTLGPSCVANEGVGVSDNLTVTLYYPKYWATVNYNQTSGSFTYKIIKTFYENGEQPITINKVIASPAGVQTTDAQTVTLGSTFTVTEGAVLDLSANVGKFQGVTKEKLLQPVAEYEPPQKEVVANGTGLTTRLTVDGQTMSLPKTESVNFRFNKDNLPADNVTGAYTLDLKGRILPKYSQKYQLLFEYTGNPDDLIIEIDGKVVTDYGTDISAVESQQFTPTPGCALRVITMGLEGGTFYSVKITYKGDVSDATDDVLRFLWWSTTQQMGLVIKERMYPVIQHNDMIRGVEFTDGTVQIENEHVAYTNPGTYAVYSGIDFGDGGNHYIFKIHAAAIRNELSQGGTLQIRRNNKDGELLGTLEFEPTSDTGWGTYVWSSTLMHIPSGLKGTVDICLVFQPKVSNGFLMNYDQFTFARAGDGGAMALATSIIDGKSFTDATAEIEGDHMAWTRPNAYALYTNLDFGETPQNYTFKIMAGAINNEHSQGGTMELRLNSPTGTVIGVLDFTPTGDWAKYEEQIVKLSQPLSGVQDICLVFHPNSDFLFNYTTFTFEKERILTPFDKFTDVATPIYHLGLAGATEQDAHWTDYRYIAQEVVPTKADLYGAALALNLTAGKATVHMELRNEPNGQALATTEQMIESKGNGVAFYDVRFTEKVTVEPQKLYYLVYYLTAREAGNVCIAHGANLGANKAEYVGYVWKMADGQPVVYSAGDKNLTFGFQLITTEEEPTDQEIADEVIAKIDALNVQSLEDASAVAAARRAYDGLTDAQKDLVTNLQKLTDAEAKIDELKAQADQEAIDKAAAKAVQDQIDELNVQSLDDKPAVVAARTAYDGLTDTQKDLVTNLQKLVDAEAKIAQLEKPVDPPVTVTYGDVDGNGKVEATDALEVLKSVVGKVTLTDEQLVKADTDGNSKIEATDALNILKKVVGKIDKFPVEE